MDIFLIVHFLFLLWDLGKYNTNCRIPAESCVKTSAKIYVNTFHSVQVVVMAEALTIMVLIIIKEQEVMVEAMASKGKSKKLPLLRPETMLATAVVKRLLYTKLFKGTYNSLPESYVNPKA